MLEIGQEYVFDIQDHEYVHDVLATIGDEDGGQGSARRRPARRCGSPERAQVLFNVRKKLQHVVDLTSKFYSLSDPTPAVRILRNYRDHRFYEVEFVEPFYVIFAGGPSRVMCIVVEDTELDVAPSYVLK